MGEVINSSTVSTPSSSYSDSSFNENSLSTHETKSFLTEKFNINKLSKQTIMEKMTEIIEDVIEQKNCNQTKKNIFYSKHMPNISIYDYLARIEKYTKLENSSLILTLIYIDRIYNKRDLDLNKFNAHKLLFTAILIAMKYNEDKIYDMECYAKIGGISNKELNNLEYNFLILIDYDLFVEKEEYQNYCNYFRNN